MKQENELRKIVSSICDGYVETIMDAIIEDNNIKGFPITIAVWHFMVEIKERNIVMDLNDVFVDILIDRLYREISNFLAR
jgi:hypothetical protein